MNRQQRRKENSTEKKVIDRRLNWLNTLTKEQLLIIEKVVKQATEKTLEQTLSQVTTCVAGALIEKIDDLLSMDEIYEILRLTDENLKENGMFLEKIGDDWEGYLMRMETIVKDRVIELLDKGKGQKEIVQALKGEFPKLTSSHINMAYKTGKEDWAKRCNFDGREEVEEMKKAKVATKKNEILKEVLSDVAAETTVTVEETPAIENKGLEVNPFNDIDRFKIISRDITFEGEFSQYRRTTDALYAGDLSFKSKEEIEDYIYRETIKLGKIGDELYQAFDMR